MTVAEIYSLLGKFIKDSIGGRFKIGVLDVERYELAIQLIVTYKDHGDIEHGTPGINPDKTIFQAINELHRITTKGGNNRWNKLKMQLFSGDVFNLEFIYDDEMEDRITFLGLGGTAEEWDEAE